MILIWVRYSNLLGYCPKIEKVQGQGTRKAWDFSSQLVTHLGEDPPSTPGFSEHRISPISSKTCHFGGPHFQTHPWNLLHKLPEMLWLQGAQSKTHGKGGGFLSKSNMWHRKITLFAWKNLLLIGVPQKRISALISWMYWWMLVSIPSGNLT